MKKYRLSFFLSLFLLFNFTTTAKAEVFEVNLYYDASAKTLRFDKLKEAPIVLNKEKFLSVSEFFTNQTEGEYALNLYDSKENQLLAASFNKKNGPFSLEIPYFGLADKLKIFEKSTNKELLSSDLSQFLTCNGNGVCEFEKGENLDTCLGDCGTNAVQYSPETRKLLDQSGGIIKDQATGTALLKYFPKDTATETQPPAQTSKTRFILLAGALVIIAIGGGLFLYKKFRNR